MGKEAEVQDDVEKEDDFGDAFDEAVAEGGEEEAPTEEAEEPEGEAEKEEPTPEEAEEEVVKEEEEEEPKKEEEDKTDKGEEAEVESLEKVQHKYDTVSGMFNSEVKKNKQLEDELALLKEGKKPSPTAEESKEAEDEDPEATLSAITDKISGLESVVALKEEFGDDAETAFKDVAKMIYEQVSNDVKGQFGEFSETLKPIFTDHSKAAGENHFNALEQAHPDFEELGGKLKDWIDAQPDFIKPTLEEVYKKGKANDVIQLFDTFKKETGYSKEEKPGKKPEEEIDTEKLEDMETVESKKSPVTSGKSGGVDKNNYDDAWDAA